ncbi:MAG: hypothetical protein GC179_27955 [Anaerolineaceae bacterium]|nr:hypothetical protein [Anaerolineaceae bacterium]
MRIILGIVLMIVGFVALFGIIVIPVLPPTEDNVSVNNYLQQLLCNPGEKFVREQYQTHDSDGTGYSMTPYCVNSERQREDVTGKWVLYGGGGFTLFFLLGLVLTISGAKGAVQSQINTFIPQYSSGSVNGVGITLDGLTSEKLQSLKTQMQAFSTGGDLTTKLRQIQEAKDKGLISSDEYDRLRQRILDDVT